MPDDLQLIEKLLLQIINKKITHFTLDNECADYFGCNFKIGNYHIKFRQAKTTPKKTGLFVTLWKRNNENKTEPFSVNDPFDFYIITTKQENNFGFFIFNKDIFSEKNILTNLNKEGKRGFRVYPTWTKTENNQATKTKKWQNEYFINCNENNNTINTKLNTLLNKP